MFVAQLALAQAPPPGAQPPPGGPPPGGPPVQATIKDPAATPAGNYTLDLEHVSVIARVPHGAASFNVLRFGVKEGSLVWDGANPSKIKLNVTADAMPITNPIVYRIKPEGKQMLDVGTYPEAKFVSTAVRAIGGNRYEVQGQLTLVGVTKPAVIQATFLGTGRNMEAGATTIGFTGSMDMNFQDFKPDAITSTLTLVLDAEFIKQR